MTSYILLGDPVAVLSLVFSLAFLWTSGFISGRLSRVKR